MREIYQEQQTLNFALDRFCEALKVRSFEGTKRGKRGWNNFEPEKAMLRMSEEFIEWDNAGTSDEKKVELLDMALFVFMAWWNT